MNRVRSMASTLVLLVTLGFQLPGPIVDLTAQAQITPPDRHFGHQLGADRRLARWDQIVEYFRLLEKQTDRMRVVDMGKTTMGHPFLALFISSPANLGKLEQYRQMNARLSDPRGVSESEIAKLVAEGRTVQIQSMGLHSTEVAASQMAPELAYDLLTRTDSETQRILDNVIFIMVPCFNPDGQVMVTDWYRKYVNTEYEATGLPELYHKYAGHDNNRDAFQQNLVESQYMGKLMLREWIPQAYIDHHQMGPYGARLYVPPYAEPIRPGADPLVWRELSWYGGHIAYKEEEHGKSGIINAAIYSGWGHFGFHWITPFHNIAGMLTESASARLATPLFLHPDQLQGGARGLPAYEEQTTFPNPWRGGWWRVRDIVEQQKIAGWAALDLAARNRETVLRNAYLKAKRQTERGAAGRPAAFVIPAAQHDPLTAVKLVNTLRAQGIEIRQAKKEFLSGTTLYGAGSYVVSMAQPKQGVVRYLLGRTFYPDNTYTRDAEGNPIRPYDMSTDTMAEFMGVRADPVDEAIAADLVTLTAEVAPAGRVATGAAGFAIDGRLNDSFRAVNMLIDRNVAVRRIGTAAGGLRPGDFIIGAGAEAAIADVAKRTGVDFSALQSAVTSGAHDVRRLRVAMYQRYRGGNMDEGWTRLLLEQFGFPYTSTKDAEIKAGNLNAKYDVIILPADSTAAMTGEPEAGGRGGQGRGGQGGRPQNTPPEYRSGFGREGVEALEAFVQKGGTLLTFAQAGALPIERFGLPLRNVVADLGPKEFWSPGSTLRAAFDHAHSLAYGMPAQGLATFLAGGQVYELIPTETNERTETIVTFVDRDLLQSGWLIGEPHIARKAAMVSVRHGQGRVVLIGFRAQHRAQTHGTFKLVFNALISGPPAGRTTTTDAR
jgi:hypothetical protein